MSTDDTSTIYDQTVAVILETINLNAARQIVAAKLEPKEMAAYLAKQSGFKTKDPELIKQPTPEFFTDLVFHLLRIKPEYAAATTIQFTTYEKKLGFAPLPSIVTAIANSISVYKNFPVARELVRIIIARECDPKDESVLKDFDNLVMFESLRAEKSAKLLLRLLFMLAGSFKTFKRLYVVTTCDEPIAKLVAEEIVELAGQDFYIALTR